MNGHSSSNDLTLKQLASEAAGANCKTGKASNKKKKARQPKTKQRDSTLKIEKQGKEKKRETKESRASQVNHTDQQPQATKRRNEQSSKEGKDTSDARVNNTNNSVVKPGSGKLGTNHDGQWYEGIPPLNSEQSDEQQGKLRRSRKNAVDDQTAMTKRKKAEKLLAAEVTAWHESKKQSTVSQDQWLQQVLTSGTLSDRVAAMTLMVQQSPLHNLTHLNTLVEMATKKGRREREMTIEAIKDLFATNLLPSARKLTSFEKQPLNHPGVSSTHLVYWIFEDYLKQKYSLFVSSLESASHDSMRHFRSLALRSVYELLVDFPEQEAALLTLLVNKFGDSDRKVASKATYLLQQLVNKHQAMKPVVVREIQQFLLRPTLIQKARYYAIMFLSQLPLVRGWTSLADQLVTVYFTMFEHCVRHHEINSRVMSALLTGVNRAFPYTSAANPVAAKDEKKLKAHVKNDKKAQEKIKSLEASKIRGKELDIVATLEQKADTLFKIAHEANFNTAVQALTLLFQVATAKDTFQDRFYIALYSTLFRNDLVYTNKYHLFLNLLYRALRDDSDVERSGAFLKRLLQVASYMPSSFAAASLYLASELIRRKFQLQVLVAGKEGAPPAYCSVTEGNDETTVSRELSRTDDGEKEKTYVSVTQMGISENDTPEDISDVGEDSIVEHAETHEDSQIISTSEYDNYFVMADKILRSEHSALEADDSKIISLDDEEGNLEIPNHEAVDKKAQSVQTEHTRDVASEKEPKRYDAHKRNPKFANASSSCFWELVALAFHFHPSVRRFASSIMSNPTRSIKYQGDPLSDFTLMAFLDRFVYKNPKQKFLAAKQEKNSEKIDKQDEGYAEVEGKKEDLERLKEGRLKGGSIMQPRAQDHKRGRAATERPPNEMQFSSLSEKSVREDDEFYFKYFQTKQLREKTNSSKEAYGKDSEETKMVLEELEEDVYAQSLAENLMRSQHGPVDIDDEGEEDQIHSFAHTDQLDDESIEGDTDMAVSLLRQEEADKDTQNLGGKEASQKMGSSTFASIEEYSHLMDPEESPNMRPTLASTKRGGHDTKTSSNRKYRKITP